MNLSKKWLNDYIKINISDKEFADLMTMSGSKVEGIVFEGKDLKNIVVGKITDIVRHSDSEHLWICTADIGANEPVQIVTGAQNVKKNDFVPVAADNSSIAGGKIIKKGVIRGVESAGMLCSLSELGLTKNDFPYAVEDGIFVLGDDCDKTEGIDIKNAIGLNDVITEFEITSNRPDCLSVIGLAREASASLGMRLQIKSPELPACKEDIDNLLQVEIQDAAKCYRYIGAVVTNVKITESPRWIRERLRASGVRPINNIVDITNYVMLEYGQPMHAFDIRYLEGKKVNVRCAADGEKITTLDGVERMLEPDMLVIADANKPVAVAGIMGGEYSGIMSDTNTIVFESACFNGPSVRVTAKKLGMRTESSARFEKELDPNGCLASITRALELVNQLGAGDFVNGIIDCDRSNKKQCVLKFDWEWINRFIGIILSEEQQKTLLENIGFEIKGDTVVVPTYRNDIEHLADLSEEIARFYGYENIPNIPLTGVANGRLTEKQTFEKLINDTLIACGLSEIQTYSFTGTKCFDKICLPADSENRICVCITNPLGEDTGIMRTTALPSMLEVLARNYKFRNEQAKLFEIATEYISRGDDELPVEKQNVIIGIYGNDSDFRVLAGFVEEVFSAAGISNYVIEAVKSNPSYHPGRCAKILLNGKIAAVMGEIHPQVSNNYDVNARIYVAEIDFEKLFENKNLKKSYTPLPKFPSVDRDLAFVCDTKIPVLTLREVISGAIGDLLESIALFDVYEGEQIPHGMKSVAFSIKLRSSQRTLTDKDADEAMERAVASLKKIGITLRT